MPGAENLPIYCVGDLHGTLTPKMGDLSDCLIFYRECPHTDAFDSAVLSSELLARCLKTGVRPKHCAGDADRLAAHRHRHPRRPDAGAGRCGAADGEGRSRRAGGECGGRLCLFRCAVCRRRLQHHHRRRATQRRRRRLRELAEIAWDMREGGIPKQHDLDQVVRDFKRPVGGKGPVLLVEPADNIGGGAPGDGTDVMRALLKYDVQGAGVVIADAAKRWRRCRMCRSAARSPCPSAARAARWIPGR